MKDEKIFTVYATDTDGSERRYCTVAAKSVGHAKKIAKSLGCSYGRITDVVLSQTLDVFD